MIKSIQSVMLPATERQMVAKAWRIATEVHAFQLDKANESYLFHVARVAMALDTPIEQVCGLLHDVMEDAIFTDSWALTIEMEFPPEVLACCVALCRKKDEDYPHYIRRVSENPLATKIKLLDLGDNLDPRRLCKLHPEEAMRLQAKYLAARKYLTEVHHIKEIHEIVDPAPSSVDSPGSAVQARKPWSHVGATEDC